MPNVTFNIDASGISAHVVRMERISGAMAWAVKATLGQAALRMKQKTLPVTTDKFAKRKRTFFKANSKVDFPKGNDINSMVATVGFIPKPNDASHSVEDLEQQENGGQISNRSFIALPNARNGSWNKNIATEYQMANVNNNIVDSSSGAIYGKNGKENFVLSALAVRPGGFVIGNRLTAKGNKIVYKIIGIGRQGGNTHELALPVFAVKKGRKVEPNSKFHNFAKEAALMAQKDMEKDFILIANKKLQGI